ncbi:uncharacterized protein LOC117576737 [Drosophila albomicans]|uniref:Uncharacterized protein LOC117576737 n=1 Tax=Drosophila albomicans TaxID=7291 RepID=A0A6P8XWH6_DROAB|nr:uncharacterized protein LOC117576737 [Drosophila albomicans]
MLISRGKNLLFFCFLLSICIVYNAKARQIGGSNKNCAANGDYCQTHYECCSRKCMTYSYKCAPIVHPNDYQSTYDSIPDDWFLIPQSRPHVQTVVENRFNTGANGEEIEFQTLPDDKSKTGTHAVEKVDSSLPTTYLPQFDVDSHRACRNIGSECSDNRECCTQRCHSYLHRCVT